MATKIKNIPFIGGDTMEFEFDFGTKVFGSVAECPMKIYGSIATAIKTPSDINGNADTGWREINSGYGDQAWIDTIKVLDGHYPGYFQATKDIIAQHLIELDLTSLCNSLFGGNTNAMAAACKNIITDVWARGGGSNNGVASNGVIVRRWYTGAWDNWGMVENDTSNIINMHAEDPRVDSSKYGFLINNKIYLIVYSLYPSDGTIPSEIDLDYINIKLQFTRVPDVINLLPITFPNIWAMVIKGFSPAWNTTDLPNGAIKFLLGIDQSEHSNYDVSYQNGKFVFDNWDGNTAENLWSDPISLTKFQTVNLLIEQTNSGRRMRILQNNGQVLKYSISSSRNFPGDKQMGVLMHVAGSYQADAFLNSIVFLPNKTFEDDTEAEAVLRGTAQGFENDELFDINKLTLQSGASVSNGILTFVATQGYQNNYLVIPVLPNNQYVMSGEIIGSGGYINWEEENKSRILRTSSMHFETFSETFTTSSQTNELWIHCSSTGAGTFVYKNISLKLKM